MNKQILECGICFEQLVPKQIDICTEIDCGHIYHDKSLKKWCIQCNEKDYTPNCPLCRKDISGEYLEILGINDYNNLNNNYYLSINTLKLYKFIIDNKIYADKNKLNKIFEKYPNECENVVKMIKNNLLFYHLLNI